MESGLVNPILNHPSVHRVHSDSSCLIDIIVNRSGCKRTQWKKKDAFMCPKWPEKTPWNIDKMETLETFHCFSSKFFQEKEKNPQFIFCKHSPLIYKSYSFVLCGFFMFCFLVFWFHFFIKNEDFCRLRLLLGIFGKW